ncbi:MAG: 23S rRNA (guanosine(2251)-2'-O)-methyltransferase RlmB [Betaproteobacteria bacterium]|nr:23S rRNA (guanosine(2251)-2'-O)-methyltransferase RlmB [Betaproteobacteria bacterium]
MPEPRLLFGFHAVTSRLRQDPASISRLYLRHDRTDARAQALLDQAKLAGISIEPVDNAKLDELVGHHRHQGVAAMAAPPKHAVAIEDVLDTLNEPAFLLILDGVTDPHNLGACLRSADAFGVHAIIVPKDRAVGVNATVAKVASGAADTVPVIAVTNLARTMRELKTRGIWLVGADADAPESLFTADLSGPLAWVLGAEGSGLRRLTRESCDRIVGIPLSGMVASLNVSVAAGVCLFATRQRRVQASLAQSGGSS